MKTASPILINVAAVHKLRESFLFQCWKRSLNREGDSLYFAEFKAYLESFLQLKESHFKERGQ